LQLVGRTGVLQQFQLLAFIIVLSLLSLQAIVSRTIFPLLRFQHTAYLFLQHTANLSYFLFVSFIRHLYLEHYQLEFDTIVSSCGLRSSHSLTIVCLLDSSTGETVATIAIGV
jgi:hypothetical protein